MKKEDLQIMWSNTINNLLILMKTIDPPPDPPDPKLYSYLFNGGTIDDKLQWWLDIINILNDKATKRIDEMP